MDYRGQSGEWLFWFSLAVVTIAHAQLAYLVLTYSPESDGAIETQTAAISINLEASDILDAAEQSASTEQTAAGAPGVTAEKISDKPEPVEEVAELEKVEAEPESEPEPVEQKPERIETEPVTKPLPKPQPETETKAETEPAPIAETIKAEAPQDRTLEQAEDALEQAMLAELKRREEAERKARSARKSRQPREKSARKQKKHEQRQKKRTVRNTHSSAGGSSNSRSSSARVSASTGSIRNYMSIIRSRIARNKPSGRVTGKVVIALSLSTSGNLQSARIIRSSGNGSLDRQVLSAVRRAAPFPHAPAGISSSQLSNIKVPFTFQ